MKRRLSLIIILAAILLFGSSASAQQFNRGFARGFGGMTFTPQTDVTFGVGGGVALTRSLFAIGEFGRMMDVLPSEIEALIPEIIDALDLPPGVNIDFKAPAFYGFGGIRVMSARKGGVRPYFEGGAGFAQVSVKATGSGSSQAATASVSLENDWLVVAGGGVTFFFGKSVGLEVGARYSGIFITDATSNNALAHIGVVIGF